MKSLVELGADFYVLRGVGYQFHHHITLPTPVHQIETRYTTLTISSDRKKACKCKYILIPFYQKIAQIISFADFTVKLVYIFQEKKLKC